MKEILSTIIPGKSYKVDGMTVSAPDPDSAILEYVRIQNLASQGVGALVTRMRLASELWEKAEAHIEQNQFNAAREVIAEARQHLNTH